MEELDSCYRTSRMSERWSWVKMMGGLDTTSWTLVTTAAKRVKRHWRKKSVQRWTHHLLHTVFTFIFLHVYGREERHENVLHGNRCFTITAAAGHWSARFLPEFRSALDCTQKFKYCSPWYQRVHFSPSRFVSAFLLSLISNPWSAK